MIQQADTAPRRLIVACTPADRVTALFTGEVKLDYPGIVLDMLAERNTQRLFSTAAENATYPITEMSMATHITRVANDDAWPYTAIPIVLSRAFRHKSIYINTDSGVKKPEDLKGKKIGVLQYQQTAVLWVRGILSELYNVKPQDVLWHAGEERSRITLPPDIRVVNLGKNPPLSDLLAKGEIDALISVQEPECFGKNDKVVRLFPKHREAEKAYYEETGFFPIMHIVCVDKRVLEEHPGLAVALFKAFSGAMDLAQHSLANSGVLYTALPWVADEFARTKAALGNDYWKYGFKANERELKAMTDYAKADGLAMRRVAPRELFHASTLAT